LAPQQGQRRPRPRSEKRTDSKKRPFFGRFGRKTGCSRGKNDIVRLCSCAFSRFLSAQTIDSQELGWIEPFTKKSCLKTYRGFFGLWELCDDRRVNVEKVQNEIRRPHRCCYVAAASRLPHFAHFLAEQPAN
jgi:hypothetical protein